MRTKVSEGSFVCVVNVSGARGKAIFVRSHFSESCFLEPFESATMTAAFKVTLLFLKMLSALGNIFACSKD